MDDLAAAIADPVRRAILEMLREGPLLAGEVASRFEISRPAVSRHLRVLRECGLVAMEPRGRKRLHRLDVSALEPLEAWLSGLREGHWASRFDALETEVYRTRRERRAESETETEEKTA